jgi:rare lipoprotein A
MRTGTANRKRNLSLAGLCLVFLFAGCATQSRYSQARDSAPHRPVDAANFKDAVPRVEPRSRYGNPATYVVSGKRYYTLTSSKDYRERGIASWYGTKFHGHRTSSGEPYDMYRMSAAHKSLPLPTYARVTNLQNGRSVIVKINDRGPFHDNRLIDLSYAAASRLGILGKGTGMVEVQAIDAEQYVKNQQKPAIAASKPKIQPNAAVNKAAAARDPVMFLQLGAFSDRGNAERLRTRLAGVELPGKIYITEGYASEKRVYRVRIGPLETVESADQVAQILSGKGMPPPRVVID